MFCWLKQQRDAVCAAPAPWPGWDFTLLGFLQGCFAAGKCWLPSWGTGGWMLLAALGFGGCCPCHGQVESGAWAAGTGKNLMEVGWEI